MPLETAYPIFPQCNRLEGLFVRTVATLPLAVSPARDNPYSGLAVEQIRHTARMVPQEVLPIQFADRVA